MMHSYALEKREILGILFKEKRVLFLAFFGIFFVVFGVSFLMSPKYEATAKLLIKSGREFENRPDPGQSAAVVPYLTKQEIMNSELEILSSKDLAEDVINRIGLDTLYPDIAASVSSDTRPMDEAVKQFKKSLKPETAMMSEVITVHFLHKNRDLAVEALNDLLQIYQEKHAHLYSDNRSEFLEKKTRDYMDQLDKVTAKITTLRQTQNIYDLTAQRGQLIQDRSLVAETLRALQTRALDQHGRATYFAERLKSLSPFVVEGVPSHSTALQNWKVQDPAYVDPAYDDAVLKLQTAEADVSALDQQIALQKHTLDTMDARLKSMEDAANTLESLEREHAMLDGLVRMTRAGYEQAVTNEDLDRQKIVSVDLFEKPDASSIPAKPNHLLYALLGLVMGTMGSLGILGYAMVFRQTLISAESVERLIGIKVLATMPERA